MFKLEFTRVGFKKKEQILFIESWIKYVKNVRQIRSAIHIKKSRKKMAYPFIIHSPLLQNYITIWMELSNMWIE